MQIHLGRSNVIIVYVFCNMFDPETLKRYYTRRKSTSVAQTLL